MIHLFSYERQCSRECISRAIETGRREELAREDAMRRAREHPTTEPHPFVMTEWITRAASVAERERKDQERATLQFLRGGRT
jgi:hypothetical protein